MLNNLKINNNYIINMDELCGDNDMNYFTSYNVQDCPEPNPATTFFLLLSIVPISFLFAMIAVSQYLVATNELIIDDEIDEEKPLYEDKYPLQKISTNKNPNTDLLSIIENTPNGNVFMKYNLENEGFDYWSDYKEIPFSHLETVARKYVNTFCFFC